MKLDLGALLSALLCVALPAAADRAMQPALQETPAGKVCPDALQRSQCRQRCSPVKMIFQPCPAAQAGDPATCRDDAIERCLEQCMAEQCRAG